MRPALLVTFVLVLASACGQEPLSATTPRAPAAASPSPAPSAPPVVAAHPLVEPPAPPTRIATRIAWLVPDRCSVFERDATFHLPVGTRVAVLETTSNGCAHVRVTIPTAGEVIGFVAAAWLSPGASYLAEPRLADWGAANPTSLGQQPEIADAMHAADVEKADSADLKRWEHVRASAQCPANAPAFCTSTNQCGHVVEITSGSDKMRAAIALASCPDEKSHKDALDLLDQLSEQCFGADRSGRDCPRRVSVEDERHRIAGLEEPAP
jgi:hypothetical protein